MSGEIVCDVLDEYDKDGRRCGTSSGIFTVLFRMVIINSLNHVVYISSKVNGVAHSDRPTV